MQTETAKPLRTQKGQDLIVHSTSKSALLIIMTVSCLLQVGKGYAGRANKSTTKAEAAAICEEGFASVEKLYL